MQDLTPLLFVTAFVGGAIAAVSGFGIGSLITPLLAISAGTKLAVAAVAIPHLLGTAFRYWRLGGRPDRRVLASFGLTSAAGGLLGALLHGRLGSPSLSLVFGTLLLLVALSEFTGLAARLHFEGRWAWAAGALSGFLGGLVGNQGGIRSAALLSFGMDKRTFVATGTAIGLMVDGARTPVYVWNAGSDLASLAVPIAVASAGVLAGTLIGGSLLAHIPRRAYRPLIASLVGALGVLMLLRA
jgi:uncharacterized membrane protein YfcA